MAMKPAGVGTTVGVAKRDAAADSRPEAGTKRSCTSFSTPALSPVTVPDADVRLVPESVAQPYGLAAGHCSAGSFARHWYTALV